MNLRQVHHALIRKLGMDPFSADFNTRELGRHADVISERVRVGWEAEMWPNILVVETRTIADADFPAIYFVTSGQDEIGMVDLNACVFGEDPRTSDKAPFSGLRWINGGFVLDTDDVEDGDEVYIRYRPPAPEFSLVPWDPGTIYVAGDSVFQNGDSWQALSGSENVRPGTDGDVWELTVFPAFLSEYVKWGAHADMMSEDEAIAKSEARAIGELERLRDLYLEQSGFGRSVVFRR